jgi:hypothetical protein
MLVTTLALALMVSLIWISVANPQTAPLHLLGAGATEAPAGIRRIMAALLVVACVLGAAGGIVLLALDLRAGTRRPAEASNGPSRPD